MIGGSPRFGSGGLKASSGPAISTSHRISGDSTFRAAADKARSRLVRLPGPIDSARRREAVKVFLEMRANNPAEKLYRAEGFTQIGQRRDYYRTVTGHALDALTFGREV